MALKGSDFGTAPGDLGAYIRKLQDSGVIGDFDIATFDPTEVVMQNLGVRKRSKLAEFVDRMENVARASDIAVRAEILKQTIIDGKKEAAKQGKALSTKDEEILSRMALTRAREFINFRRQGSSGVVRSLASMVPFFNAYLQGMDVIYRAATGRANPAGLSQKEARRMFARRAAMMMGLTAVYALSSMAADEDYLETSDRVMFGNWIIPGTDVRIPVANEYAAMFKAPVEAAIRAFVRSGTPEEQTTKQLVGSVLGFLGDQMLYGVPFPAAFKPLVENWTNYSFFTGRNLEGLYQRELMAVDRANPSTSELARSISEFVHGLTGGAWAPSPIDVDNTIQGYLGSVGGLLTMTTDQLINPDRIDRPIHQQFLLSAFTVDPVRSSRIDEFYDFRDRVMQRHNSLLRLAQTEPEKIEEFVDKHGAELAFAKSLNATLQRLSDIRKYRTQLTDGTLREVYTPAERQKMLEEARRLEVETVSWLRQARAEYREAMKAQGLSAGRV